MEDTYNIYFATNRLAISTKPIDEITTTLSAEELTSAEEICRTLNIYGSISIITPNPEQFYNYVSSLFVEVEAAGGIATNPQGEDLMIYRNRRWDLPKGHLERGESIEQCAVREVEEETGVRNLTIGEKICTTTHIYNMKGRWEIKRTHWFKMSTTSLTSSLTPQIEEGIEQVSWCSPSQVAENLKSAFPTIQAVYHAARHGEL